MIKLDLVTPEKTFLSEAVEMVVLPGTEGDFGVMENHMPFISSLKPGAARIFKNDKQIMAIFVTGGFVETDGKQVTVLAETAFGFEDIDMSDAIAKLEAAQNRLEELRATSEESPIETKKLENEVELYSSMVNIAGDNYV